MNLIEILAYRRSSNGFKSITLTIGMVKKMKVYSLSGQSGTGKSTSALEFAHKHNIDAIIDDGLLIVRGEKKAGISAKFEKNTITAVRRAIFDEESHRLEVAEAIQAEAIQSLLIIGTSDRMTQKIAKRLDVAPIHHYYYVSDIRTPKEIQIARFIRETQGKHVMPIPHAQVEQNFFKRLIKKGKDIFSHKREKIGETTIVRPDFHGQTITIARSVYIQILTHLLNENELVAKVDSIRISIESLPKMTITISLTAPLNYSVPTKLRGLQHEIAEAFQLHFGIEPSEINFFIKGIEHKKR
ncbi:hypothetical protein [Lysinibacillus sp. 54212]|uniref:hypothetical protein n=1 Tax=Lysinibacillus sp. 54212 TaxID=3119829 RepID=UPI002FCA29F2